MLQTFQNEWDAVMVETYELRKQLEQCRSELSASLYKQDAAERTVARLVKERDHALEMARAGGGVQGGAMVAVEQDTGDVEAMEVEGGGLSNDQESVLQATADALIEQRKVRSVSSSTAASSEIEGLKESSSHQLISSSKKGLSAIARNGDMMAVGAVDGGLVVLNSAQKVVATLKGHKKQISQLAWQGGILASASHDATVRVWTASGKKPYAAAHCFSTIHSNSVMGLSMHPSGSFVASVSSDQTWALLDLNAGLPVYTVAVPSIGAFSSCAFHPDGLLLATGTEDPGYQLRLWDVKSKENVISFPGHSDIIKSIAFSENGVHLATGSIDSTLKLWDLRNLDEPIFASETLGAPVTSVSFDWSGQFVAAGGQDVQVFAVKDQGLSHLTRLAGHTSTVTGVCWGDDAKSLMSVASDKTMKIFE